MKTTKENCQQTNVSFVNFSCVHRVRLYVMQYSLTGKWVLIPFAAIFTDIPRADKSL